MSAPKRCERVGSDELRRNFRCGKLAEWTVEGLHGDWHACEAHSREALLNDAIVFDADGEPVGAFL